jgi:hypothetical protein
MNDALSGNTLLEAAINWYQTSGFLPIPKSDCIEGVPDSSVFFSDAEVALSSNSINYTHEFKSSCIPAFAAISMGLSEHSLAKVLAWHNNSFEYLSNIRFLDQENAFPHLFLPTDKTLTPLEVLIQAAKAYASDPELVKDLFAGCARNPTSRVHVSVMHTDQSSLWPQTQIDEHASLLLSESPGIVDEFRNFEYVAMRPWKLSEMANGNVVDHMCRSGMFTESVLRKQTGIFSHWEELLSETIIDDECVPQQMLSAFTKVMDSTTITAIKRGLLSVSVEATDEELHISKIYPVLKKVFAGSEELNSVLNSTMFKMNFIDRGTSLLELNEVQGDTDFFEDIMADFNPLTSKIAKELLSRPIEHIGLNDFAVFSKLKNFRLKSQVFDFSPERLACHMLDSLNSFTSHRVHNSSEKHFVDRKATEGIKDMLAILRRGHDFDYSLLTNRTDRNIVLMAGEGFDVRKFKGVSNHAKGRILEEGLGL